MRQGQVTVNVYRVTYFRKGQPHEYVVQAANAAQARLRLICLLPDIDIKSTMLLPYGVY